MLVLRTLGHLFLLGISLAFIGLLGAFGLFSWFLVNYTKDLPEFSKLKDYQPPVVTRVYTDDGQLLAEFAEEKRVFVPITSMPDIVKQAFLSAEDQNFYNHNGLDIYGIGRAVLTNVRALGSDSRLVGASTITQQVAKNMLLTNEVSFERKFKEAILALRMEKVLSKDRLLELYLNEIYLGQGAYGIAAAAQTYFNKGLDDLSLEEVAYLAALPKAPNNYHPVRRNQAALTRRNWVIGRMLEDGHITRDQAEIARLQPLDASNMSTERSAVRAPYFAEEIRRFLRETRGFDGLYKDGLIVRSTLNPELQTYAERAFRYGIMAYDRRHGWRGAIARFDDNSNWAERLQNIPIQSGMLPDWHLGVALKKQNGKISVGIANGREVELDENDVKWAGDKMQAGDIIMVSPPSYLDVEHSKDILTFTPTGEDSPTWRLRQVPTVQGGFVAIDPYTGRVLAMQGGWDYEKSEFNRVTQAQRQVGSAFKPFIYLTALEEGYTPSTKVLDAPISFSMGRGQGVWSPTNYDSDKYYGPTTLRVGLEKSYNLMTVRLAAHLGMNRIAQTVNRFNIYDEMQTHLANSLGAQEATLLRLTLGFGMLVNGGQKVSPTFIDRIQDRNGVTVYARGGRSCIDCGPRIAWTPDQPVPHIEREEDLVTDPRIAYQMVSMLEGVVQRGTAARRMAGVDFPVAGKTGTTNDNRDAWFIGFTPDLVIGTYIGYDRPRSLGRGETGGVAALPLFRAFIDQYTDNREAMPFRIPTGISLVQVNATTGLRTSPSDPRAIWEAFLRTEEDTISPDSTPDSTYEYNAPLTPSSDPLLGDDAYAQPQPPSTDGLYGHDTTYGNDDGLGLYKTHENQTPDLMPPAPQPVINNGVLGGTGGIY